MKLIYKGKFDGNPDSIPHGEHKPGAVKFKEPEDSKKLGLIANSIALLIMIVAAAGIIIRGGFKSISILGMVLSNLTLFPHEIIHAICFKNEVYLYTDLKNGILFVTGPEDMSKARFVFMSLLPNIVFGFVPYILFMINPQLKLLGTMGAMCISMGAGDYLNVYNALTQMPKGARTYLHGFNSWWYMP
ncbi:MAG: DUF3267 domain-containing protein [Oscillospiraceae bacterium]|nr:DUF3267 domain-containing protein [Oscillospiraceae bacterium]